MRDSFSKTTSMLGTPLDFLGGARTVHLLADGRRRKRAQRGVTLIELLIVAALIALIAGLSFPSAAAGIESMRLRSAADTIANFLSAAIDHAERREQVIEVWISPQDNVLIARSPDLGFQRRLEIPPMFRIISIQPAAEVSEGLPRRFLMYPGGTVPHIGVEIASQSGRKRLVSVDPLSGLPHSELVTK
jgi:prepilin-type N-terminal cleavage/methylation domain-containing protein